MRAPALRISLIKLLVPRPVEDDDHQIFNAPVQYLGNHIQVVRHRRLEIDHALAGGPDDDLLHVAVGRVQQASLLRGGQHRNGAGRPCGAQVCTFQRIDRNIHRGIAAAVLLANFFADVQHGGFVAFTLADHDGPIHRHRVHDTAHGLGSHLVGILAVALPHGLAAGDGRFLDYA